MFLNWDFGLLNSLRKKFDDMGLYVKVLPFPAPDNYHENEPYLTAEVKPVTAGSDGCARTDIVLTLQNKAANTENTLNMKILKTLNSISKSSLSLDEGSESIGEANIKISSIDNRQNQLSVTISSLISLKRLYYDI